MSLLRSLSAGEWVLVAGFAGMVVLACVVGWMDMDDDDWAGRQW